MKYPFSEKVDILGTNYSIQLKDVDEDPGLKAATSCVYGYTDGIEKRIVLNDRSKRPKFDEKEMGARAIAMAKKTLRHEIVHAFLIESGLQYNTRAVTAWSDNEEMVDWIALQAPKMIEAWTKAGAL